MKNAAILLLLAFLGARPAAADEIWQCPDGRYTVLEKYPKFLNRDEPPLGYKIIENNSAALIAVSTDISADYLGVGIFLLRKSDGARLRFGNGLSATNKLRSADVKTAPPVSYCRKL